MHVGRRVRVTGRVQGVWFRAWTQQQANELGVSGWVRNAADGSVEAHLAGEEGAVAELIERLREGPPSAVVSRVEVAEVDPETRDRFDVK
ncbi:MAG TPA: acylphosphatase [Sphingomicrobium sp.]|nr:acylphosphatase [Sphingomicrobium sp.]